MQTNTLTLYKTDAEQLAALRVPFFITDVRKRDQNGMVLSFYEHHTVQNRLLDIFGSGVSLTTVTTMADKETNIAHVEVLVEVEWVSGRRSKVSGWGASPIMKSGDHFKAAYSDAVKVAATKLGCGLELYDKKYRDEVDVRLKKIEDQEAERALLTCQGCNGEIKGGTRKNQQGAEIELSARQVATSTRKRFGKRFCMCCGENAGKEASPALMASQEVITY